MDLESRQLRHLLAIARCGTFGRAAATLRMSQPALSNSISDLERRIGERVLQRGRHGAQLTDAGAALVRHAEIVEEHLLRAREELRHRKLKLEGPLMIGATPVAAAGLIPRALARLKREIPNATVQVIELIYHEAMAALLKGSVDLMVGPIGVYAPVEGIDEERLTSDPFCVVLRHDHRLRRRRSLSLAQLHDVDWVLPNDRSAFHRQLEAMFIAAGVAWPSGGIFTNSMVAMRSIVIHSDCVAVMPKQLIATEEKMGLLHGVRLSEAGSTRALGVSWAAQRRSSPLAQRFVHLLRECAAAAP